MLGEVEMTEWSNIMYMVCLEPTSRVRIPIPPDKTWYMITVLAQETIQPRQTLQITNQRNKRAKNKFFVFCFLPKSFVGFDGLGAALEVRIFGMDSDQSDGRISLAVFLRHAATDSITFYHLFYNFTIVTGTN